MKITVFHIFASIVVIKLLSLYTNFKFILLLSVFLVVFILYSNNNFLFDIPIFKNITINKLFEDKKKNLLNFVSEKKTYLNSEIQKKIINGTNIYINNMSYVFYGKPKLCNYYFDILLEQRNEIINNANSYIITIPQYENYNFFEQYVKQLHELLDDIFEFTKQICPIYNIPPFMPYNQFKNIHSYQQI